MKKFLYVFVFVFLVALGVTGNSKIVLATQGADVTAPEVSKVTVNTQEVAKSGTISLTLDIVEEGTGVKNISLTLYGYKGNQMVAISGSLNEFSGQYSESVNIEIPVTMDDVATTYYVGQIDIRDSAGNTRMYWNGWKQDGYDLDEENQAYIPDFYSDNNVCYIESGKTINVIYDGDDVAPFITDIEILTKSVDKGGSIDLELDVVEDTAIKSISVQLYGYKGNQIIYCFGTTTWEQEGNKIFVKIRVPSTTMSGTYYIGSIDISDTIGNARMYWNGWKEQGYDIDESEQAYVPDFFANEYKCNIKNAATIDVLSNGDDEAPVITNIRLSSYEIEKPGVITAEIDVQDSSAIQMVSLNLYCYNGNKMEMISNSIYDEEGINAGTIKIDIPVSTDVVCGKYYVGQVGVDDVAGNHRMYWNGWKENGYDLEEGKAYVPDFYDPNYKMYIEDNKTVVIKEEFDVAFEVGLSNPKIFEHINSMPEATAGKIYIDSKGVALKEIFEAIKGKDKTLVFYKDNYQWVFNGLDVTTPKDVQLNVEFEKVSGKDYGFDSDLLKIVFEKNGELPGKANVRIKSDYTYQIFELSNSMYLYYLNEDTGRVELESDSDVKHVLDGTDHWCQFDISHNSTFMVSGIKVKQNVKVSKISISGVSKKLAVGKKMSLSVAIQPTYATDRSVTWKSSNKKYVTVNSKGVVTAKKAGAGKKVTITATAKDGSKKKAKYTITIMKHSVKSIKLKASKSVKAGRSIKVKATVKTTGKSANKKLQWTSSNKKYATVNSKGKVTTKKAGKGKKVKITAKATDGSNKKATITIKIK